MLLPGNLFCCDAAAFDDACHPGSAQPMGDVSIVRLKKKSYFDLLRRNPDAAIEVIKYLSNRLRESQEKAKIFALGGADQRLAALLVDLAARCGVQVLHGIRLSV
jgi:CRP/FNR family transcriptional regulator